MACIVLFSTLSFTVEKHICAGEVADIALFGNLERCEMPDENHDNKLVNFDKQSCCQDEVHFVQGANSELKKNKKAQEQTQVFATLFIYTYLNLFSNLEADSNPYLNYTPPIVINDIQILYDTFLI